MRIVKIVYTDKGPGCIEIIYSNGEAEICMPCDKREARKLAEDNDISLDNERGEAI